MILEAVNEKKNFALNTLLRNPRSASFLIQQRRRVGRSFDYTSVPPERLAKMKLPRSTVNYTHIMYGQVDVRFRPNP